MNIPTLTLLITTEILLGLLLTHSAPAYIQTGLALLQGALL